MLYIKINKDMLKVATYSVGYYESLTDEVKQKIGEVHLVNGIPSFEYKIGKSQEIYYNPETKEFSVEYNDRELTPEEKLQVLQTENIELKNKIDLMQGALDDLLLGGL